MSCKTAMSCCSVSMSKPSDPSPLALFKKDLKKWWPAIVIVIILWAVFSLVLGTSCTLVWFTGLPCPFCGTTRAIWCALRGQFALSFTMQPLWPSVFAVAILFCLSRYFRLFPLKWMLPVCILVFMAFVVLYIYRMCTAFPGEAPMIYKTPNLLYWIQNIF